ncbi:MAG: hypothetical protein ACOC96_05650, partial [Actinomycetota bacterium]
MSSWRAIATLFGAVADRPDADQLPYGTQWHDTATGITYATDEVEWHEIGIAPDQVSSDAGSGAVGPWIADALAAGADGETLTLLDGRRTVVPVCEAASVGCVVVHLSEAVAAGSVSVRLTVDGSPRGDPVEIT